MSGEKPKSGSQSPAGQAWPANRQNLQLAGYRFQYARRCKLCGAPIGFWRTPARPGQPGSGGKLIPLDRRPDATGLASQETFMPHWAICPNAEEFRKKHNIIEQREMFK